MLLRKVILGGKTAPKNETFGEALAKAIQKNISKFYNTQGWRGPNREEGDWRARNDAWFGFTRIFEKKPFEFQRGMILTALDIIKTEQKTASKWSQDAKWLKELLGWRLADNKLLTRYVRANENNTDAISELIANLKDIAIDTMSQTDYLTEDIFYDSQSKVEFALRYLKDIALNFTNPLLKSESIMAMAQIFILANRLPQSPFSGTQISNNCTHSISEIINDAFQNDQMETLEKLLFYGPLNTNPFKQLATLQIHPSLSLVKRVDGKAFTRI